MSHDFKRSEFWWKETFAGFLTGTLYGVTNAVVGHPLDTIKTKMQVVKEYSGKNVIQTFIILFKKEGIRGFFRGVIPPICGGSIFRSAQFGVYEAVYSKFDKNPFLTSKIPFTFGLEYRILLGGIASGTARSLIECPFEYSKVQGQVGNKWQFARIYQGFRALWLRTTGLMTTYFVMIDFFKRNTNAYKKQHFVFLMNGFCATLAFLVIWPLEIAKNSIQSQKNNKGEKYSLNKIIRQRIKKYGFINGLFKGSVPGLASVFIRNGASMVVMQRAQKLLTDYGFRDK